MIFRTLLASVGLMALAACSKGANELIVAKDVAPAEKRVGAPADDAVDRPETRPSDLDANQVAVAPDAPPPPAAGPPPPDAHAGPQASEPQPSPPVTVKDLMGDVDPAHDPAFAAVPTAYGPKGGMYANRQALAAFIAMHDAAKNDGIDLVVVSAFRSFKDQKRIWEDKWTGKTLVDGGKLPATVPDPRARAEKILEFSSMPGTSRHHWGTDFDLNELTNAYFASGKGKDIHTWLSLHGPSFGFCQVYSPKGPERPRGYNQEDWHWSYLPVAARYLRAYPQVVGYERLNGFAGAEAAKAIDVIANYVAGINPDCLR